MRCCEVCICVLHDRVFSAGWSGRANWMQTGGEFSFTGYMRSINFKLMISNYAALCICPLPYSCHFHCVLYIKLLIPWLYLKKKRFPMHTNFPESPVGYSVYFLFNYIFIKYLFICEKYVVIQSMIVYFTHLFLYLFSNDFRFLKY